MRCSANNSVRFWLHDGLATHFVRCSPMHPGAQIESLATERTEVVMSAIRVCATDPGDAPQIVPARAESTSHMLGPFRPKASVLLPVSIFVLLAELVEMTIKDIV